MQFSIHQDGLGRKNVRKQQGRIFLTHTVNLIRNEASNWGNCVETYLCTQNVWSYMYNGMEDVLQGCGDACVVVLHCTLFFAWALGAPKMTPLII